MVDRDAVTLFPDVVNGARVWSVQPGDDPFDSDRGQWDDGNNLPCLEPGVVVVAYDRNVDTNARLRKERVEAITITVPSVGRRRLGERLRGATVAVSAQRAHTDPDRSNWVPGARRHGVNGGDNSERN